MKLSVALFFAGFFGALAVLFFLLSFGTDYWLLASETCNSGEKIESESEKRGDWVEIQDNTTFSHEGFFWRCSFGGKMEEDTFWKFWFTNQPPSKECKHAYLFPFPESGQSHNATSYDTAVIYRGFWSIFMLVGVFAVVMGGFIIICAAPFASQRLYKAGGGLFLTAGLLFLAVIVMYVIWIQVLDVVERYVDHKRATHCADFLLSIHYGLSFMFAPVGVFFSLLAGLLFFLIGRSVQMQYN